MKSLLISQIEGRARTRERKNLANWIDSFIKGCEWNNRSKEEMIERLKKKMNKLRGVS